MSDNRGYLRDRCRGSDMYYLRDRCRGSDMYYLRDRCRVSDNRGYVLSQGPV